MVLLPTPPADAVVVVVAGAVPGGGGAAAVVVVATGPGAGAGAGSLVVACMGFDAPSAPDMRLLNIAARAAPVLLRSFDNGLKVIGGAAGLLLSDDRSDITEESDVESNDPLYGLMNPAVVLFLS